MKNLKQIINESKKRPERRLGVVALLLGLVSGCAFYTFSKDQHWFNVGNNTDGGLQKVYPSVEGRDFARHQNGLNYHAIVIGVDEYGEVNSSGWKDLNTAVGDAQQVGHVLKKKYGFKVQELINQDASLQKVVTTLDRELLKLGPSDAAVVYFAGHGHYDEKYDEGYWIPYGTPYELDGRLAREQWISNSLIAEILQASEARHILVIADSCYSGSLFKGEEKFTSPTEGLAQYIKLFQKPSRILFTSGNLEPVLDSGAGHSVFANQLLDFLETPPQQIFSASELGFQVRKQLSSVADQQVRLEALNLKRHKGGEFIFAMKESAWPEAEALRSLSGSYSSAAVDTDLSRVLLLHRSGAVESAKRSAEFLKKTHSEPESKQRLNIHLAQGLDGLSGRSDILETIKALESRAVEYKADTGMEAYAKPRVVAWIGPSRNEGYQAEAMEVLYQFALDQTMLERKGFSVMARGQLQELLEGLNLGSSAVAENAARLELQKIIPAGILLVAQLSGESGQEQLFVKAVDVETAEILGVFRGLRSQASDEFEVVQSVMDEVVEKLREVRPLTAGVLQQMSNTEWRVGVGAFHGAFMGMKFRLVERVPTLDGAYGDFREVDLGSAEIVELSEMSSTVTVDLHAEALPGKGLKLVEL